MLYLWIAIITFISTAGGVFMGIIIHNYRLLKNQKKEDNQEQEARDMIKRQTFIEAYFELKENFGLLNNILKLIEEKKESQIGPYLDGITIEKAFGLAKNLKLDKLEFLIMDKLHTVMLSKNKIEFYRKLYDDKIVNHLEFRANLTDMIEDLKSTIKFIDSNYKEIFPDIRLIPGQSEKKRKPMRSPNSDRSFSF